MTNNKTILNQLTLSSESGCLFHTHTNPEFDKVLLKLC